MPRQHVTWNESGFLLPLPDSKAIQIHLCIAKDIGKSLLKGGRKLSSISPFSLTLCLSGGKKTSSHSWGRSEGRGDRGRVLGLQRPGQRPLEADSWVLNEGTDIRRIPCARARPVHRRLCRRSPESPCRIQT